MENNSCISWILQTAFSVIKSFTFLAGSWYHHSAFGFKSLIKDILFAAKEAEYCLYEFTNTDIPFDKGRFP